MAKNYPDRTELAMSDEDGCIVIIRNGEVVGSVDRVQTIKFAQDCLAWEPKLPEVLHSLNGSDHV